MTRKDKRSVSQRKKDRLVLKLAGAIAGVLSLVIQDILKQEAKKGE